MVRAFLPRVLRFALNRALAPLSGKVGRIELSLWRGTVVVNDLHFIGPRDRAGLCDLTVERVQAEWSWPSLLRRQLVLSLRVEAPHAQILLRSPMPKSAEGRMVERQAANDDAPPSVPLTQILARLPELVLERARIAHGQVVVGILASDPPFVAYVRDIQVLAHHLRTRPAEEAPFVALSARVPGGELQAAVRAEPFAHPPVADLLLEVDNFDLTTLSPLSERVAKAELAEGHLSLFAAMHTRDGEIRGHVKPLLHDIAIADVHTAPVREAWDRLLALGAKLLDNPQRDQIATDIPVRGTLASPNIDVLAAIATLLQNAFGAALQPGFAEEAVSADRLRRATESGGSGQDRVR